MSGYILLVEDSPTQAMGMVDALEQARFEVTWVTTGADALAAIGARRPDLVITDYHLPDMPGDELCQLMRSRIDTRDIPVILLTVEQAERLELRALQSGVDDFFEKTVQPSAILPRVHSLLRQGRSLSRGLPQGAPARPRLLLGISGRTRHELLLSGFEELGFEVRSISTLPEAVALRHEADGILLDQSLVAEDESAAWRTLLDPESAAQKGGPVMILAPRGESNAFLLEAGADDVIASDVEPQVLLVKVKNQIHRHRARRENVELEARYREQELRASLASQLEAKNEELSASYQRLQETQGQLVHSERMAALGQMVAGMAHEINNPLAYVTANVYNVLGWLNGLEATATTSFDAPQIARWERVKARLGESLEGLERVKELVLQLRTYSRLDEGDFKEIDVRDSVASVLRILSHRIRHQEIELVEEYRFDQALSCHPGAFNQVVMNLLSNALDVLPQGGRLTLETEHHEGKFRLVVSDNGPGMPQALQEKIFEPFFTTKPAGKGTGLGLAISRQIVEGHGGALSLLSSVEGLTSFAVIIPTEGGPNS